MSLCDTQRALEMVIAGKAIKVALFPEPGWCRR